MMSEITSQLTPMVTFVVVNWNQCSLTLDCLASLRQQNYANFSVVLVDNGSHDETVTAVRAAFPEAAICQNGANLGIAAANNVGIRYAQQAGSQYIFLLNNDTVVDPNMLSQLVSVAESQPTIGMVGPTMLYFDEPEAIWCAGNAINWRNGATLRLRSEQPLGSVMDLAPQPVDFITSCAVLIKSSVFRTVGLMDERYFIYYDETDWFVRANRAGWQAVYVPSAKMWHKVSATMGESSPITEYYMVRNNFLFLGKHLAGMARLGAMLRVGGRNLLAILAYTFKNQNGIRSANRNAKWFGMRDALLRRWGPMRPAIQAQIKRSSA